MSAFLWQLLRTNLKAATALRGRFLLQVAFMALNNWVFFSFWWLLLQRVPSLRGWQLSDIAVLFGVSACGFGVGALLAGGTRELGRAIDDGGLDALLTQPKPTLVYALGSHSSVSGLGDVFSGLALILLFGGLSASALPWLVLATLSSAAIFVASGTLFFGIAFWLPRSDSVSIKLWESLITFSLYPESFFGGAVRIALYTVIPAGFAGFVPAALVRNPSWELALLAIAAPLAYWALAARVFAAGLGRYASGSRFGVWGE